MYTDIFDNASSNSHYFLSEEQGVSWMEPGPESVAYGEVKHCGLNPSSTGESEEF